MVVNPAILAGLGVSVAPVGSRGVGVYKLPFRLSEAEALVGLLVRPRRDGDSQKNVGSKAPRETGLGGAVVQERHPAAVVGNCS